MSTDSKTDELSSLPERRSEGTPGLGLSRRDLLVAGLVGGALLASARSAGATEGPRGPTAPGRPDHDYSPVTVPNGTKLPWKVVDGVKVFHLVAEEVDHEFAPGLKAKCWGYNGQVHGPPIRGRGAAIASASTSPTSCPRRQPCTGTACACRMGWTAWAA